MLICFEVDDILEIDMFYMPLTCSEIEDGLYTVKYDSLLLKDAVLEADSVIPPLRPDESSFSSSDSEEECDAGYAKGLSVQLRLVSLPKGLKFWN